MNRIFFLSFVFFLVSAGFSVSSQEAAWKSESVLKSGKWYKISTSGKGIYKIPYSRLSEWGFADPSKVKVFGAGGAVLSERPEEITYDDLPQLAIWHGSINGSGVLFFYAPGTTEWALDKDGDYFAHRSNQYAAKGYFFLSDNGIQQRNIAPIPEPAGEITHYTSTFDAYEIHEEDRVNLLSTGKQWFGEKFIRGSVRNFKFTLSNLDENHDVSIRVKAAARSSAASEMVISGNGKTVGELVFSRVNTSGATEIFADQREARFSMTHAGSSTLDIELDYTGGATNAEAWLDFIEINYRRKIKLETNVLFFREKISAGQGNILQFSVDKGGDDIKVWDVSDIFNVGEVPVQLDGHMARGKVKTDKLREFAVFRPGGEFPEPEGIEEVKNQNLHALPTPEYVIVSHPQFLGEAGELADFHRNNSGMHVEVVSSEKIYNEFSSGSKSATGIRNFIKMLYDRKEGLKYVLLFGDGTYDNRSSSPASEGFLPTFQSENSLNPVGSFVTDDFFVILDSGESVYNGKVDLGIGRIPASTNYEAGLVVEKIRNYHSPENHGNWRNTICFIADDEDGNVHMSDSEKLADMVNENHKTYITDKIYFDAYEQVSGPGGERYPGVTAAINDRVEKGVLLLNYVGHANERFLADEKVLDISHINSWSNAGKLPVFVTATCEFSRFDADEVSAGEYILFNPSGGGIGLFSTTRLVFAYSNFLLNQNFFRFVFERDENGERFRMGDIMRLAKINTINTTNKRSFTLLADPAMKLAVPEYRVVTATLNGKDATVETDTLGALDRVTVTGFIADPLGNKDEGFSGELVSTVFDKAVYKKTMGNSGASPMDFKTRESIIFRGTTEVKEGEFTFSFVVPRDISYQPGEGKIVCYATNGKNDAHGAFTHFYIGGEGSQIVDNKGPEIELFLDSPDFKMHDVVSKNPVLLANIFDENGINTAGTGIGHDITAILDDDYANVMVLNHFFQADPGEYTSGTIRYPLRDLPPGRHTLKLKVWDVANNSSEAEIAFEVSGDFVISGAVNYPNPVSDHTFFTFEHNQSGATLETVFEVFDPAGRRIDIFSRDVGSNGTNSNPVRWDLDGSVTVLSPGIYFYRITARNEDGIITSRTGKMLIAR